MVELCPSSRPRSHKLTHLPQPPRLCASAGDFLKHLFQLGLEFGLGGFGKGFEAILHLLHRGKFPLQSRHNLLLLEKRRERDF